MLDLSSPFGFRSLPLMLHRIRIEPVRLRYHDKGLVTDVLRGIGFRFYCTCGVTGIIQKTPRAARADFAEHVRQARLRRLQAQQR